MKSFCSIGLWLLLGVALVFPAEDHVRYRVVPLESFLNTGYQITQGTSINDHGVIVGVVYRNWSRPYPSGSLSGVLVHDPSTGFQEIGDYEGAYSQPVRINNSGQFTVYGGRGYESNGVWFYQADAVRYTPGVGFERLGDLGGSTTQATGINSQGDVVGWGYPSNQTQLMHAFIFTDAEGFVDLGTFGGLGAGAADINDQSWICGGLILPGYGNMAWIYHELEGLTILGPGTAKRINERRTVVCDNEGLDPVLIRDGKVTPLRGNAEIIPDPFSGDLNDSDVVVGSGPYRRNGLTYVGGYIWTEREGMRNLNKLIRSNSGWIISDAFDINNHGQITGTGGFESSRSMAYRLDPIPPKPRIALDTTNLVVSWTPAWPGITLEACENLASANWQTVASDNTNVVSLPRSGSMRFFRLNLQALEGLCCAPEPEEDVLHPPLAFGMAREPDSVANDFYPIYEAVPLSYFQFIAADGVHARVVLEGGGYDVEDAQLTFKWNRQIGDEWRVFAATQWATNIFDQPGIHEIQLRVSDGALWGTNRMTIEILTPVGMLATTLAFMEQRPDLEGGAGPFAKILLKAQTKFEENDLTGAVQNLEQAKAFMETHAIVSDPDINWAIQYLVQTLVEVVGNELGIGP